MLKLAIMFRDFLVQANFNNESEFYLICDSEYFSLARIIYLLYGIKVYLLGELLHIPALLALKFDETAQISINGKFLSYSKELLEQHGLKRRDYWGISGHKMEYVLRKLEVAFSDSFLLQFGIEMQEPELMNLEIFGKIIKWSRTEGILSDAEVDEIAGKLNTLIFSNSIYTP